MNYQIIRDEPIPEDIPKRGRGYIMFPEFLELEVSSDYGKGDCLVYPDNPETRYMLVKMKCQYNRATKGSFAGRHFVHRYEIRKGSPVIVIQRIA